MAKTIKEAKFERPKARLTLSTELRSEVLKERAFVDRQLVEPKVGAFSESLQPGTFK